MDLVEKVNQRRNLILLFLAFVFCSAFIDHIKISDYYLFEVLLGISCIGSIGYVFFNRKIVLIKQYILIPFFLIIVWSVAEMLLFEGLKYAPKYSILPL